VVVDSRCDWAVVFLQQGITCICRRLIGSSRAAIRCRSFRTFAEHGYLWLPSLFYRLEREPKKVLPKESGASDSPL
jgi:hypothetical protein